MTHCTNCGSPWESGSRFCTGCGEQVNAASPTPRSRGRLAIVLTALALLLGGGGVAAWATLAHSTSPPAAPSPATPPGQPQAATSPADQGDPSRTASTWLRAASASASCMSDPGHDAGKKSFSYEPEKAIDNSRDTAWRCDGALNRSAQTLSLTNVSTSHVTITILSSVGGEVANGQPPFDKVAISDIVVSVR